MQKRYEYCPNCMGAIDDGERFCSGCGFDIEGYEEKDQTLKPCTMLKDKYMLGKVIGIGGFGITYLGWDTVLQTYVAIKEYFPQFFAFRSFEDATTQVVPTVSKKEPYEKGLKRYLEEAQNLSKFYQLPGIVSVKDFFYENGTGYIVMEFIDGINLKQFLNENGGKIPEATVRSLMKPVLESLKEVHDAGLIHRDISPDNVMVDKKNRIKLIDFGSVRDQSTESEKTYTVTLKHGYAPSEQYYSKGKQGPWTDIYSICATMYRMLTGVNPPNSIERLSNDEYESPKAHGVNVSPIMEYVLQKGLAVKPEERYQDIQELMDDLFEGKATGNMQSSMSQQAVTQQQYNVQGMQQITTPYQTQNVTQQPVISQYNVQGMQQQMATPYQSQYVTQQPSSGYVTRWDEPANKKSRIWIPIVAVIVVLAIVAAFVVPSITGSGDKDEDKESNIRTTEAREDDYETEQTNTTEEDVTTQAQPEFSTEVYYNESTGEFRYLGVSAYLPYGYVYSEDDSTDESLTFIYQTEDSSIVNALVISIDYQNTVANDTVIEEFDSQIKMVYGNQCTSSNVTYNGNSGTEWNIDETSGSYEGRSLVICDGEMLIYVEYVTIGGTISDYEEFAETITY